MITLRRDKDRRLVQNDRHDIRLTFYPQEGPGHACVGFGLLAGFDEIRLPPGGRFATHPREEVESVTYVYQGSIAQQDSTGSSGVVRAGEFQRMTSGRGIRHKEMNASRNRWAHVFRISYHPRQGGVDRVHEQQRFAAAQRRNLLCVVASPDGRKDSLRISQDAIFYASLLDPGHHLIHELLRTRSAWLHVVSGAVALPDTILTQGDGAGLTAESSVSFTAQEYSEILLVDLGPATPSFAGRDIP